MHAWCSLLKMHTPSPLATCSNAAAGLVVDSRRRGKDVVNLALDLRRLLSNLNKAVQRAKGFLFRDLHILVNTWMMVRRHRSCLPSSRLCCQQEFQAAFFFRQRVRDISFHTF